MCGRYSLFLENNIRELNQIVYGIEKRYHQATEKMKTGEIFPTDMMPVLAANDDKIIPGLAAWGFPEVSGKKIIINARSETVFKKPMFQESFEFRRCVIPSTGFYEWSRSMNRQKFLFRLPQTELLYMAGIWDIFKGQPHFVILTTEANKSMEDVHDRMPLILSPKIIWDWIFDSKKALQILSQTPPNLEKQMEISQTEKE